MSTNNPMATRLLCLLLFAILPLSGQIPPPASSGPNDLVSVQFPNNQIGDIALFYETLTNKRLIRDSNLAANPQPISLVVNQPMTKKEAIALIESALTLNGYALVNVDDKTMKLLGPTKPVRGENITLYTDPGRLPPGDEIISYFMPLQYIKCEDAFNAFNLFAPNHPQTVGGYVQVPNVNALVITETATVVRRLIDLKNLIDIEGAQSATEYFPLERADAEVVAKVVSDLFEKNEDGPASRVAPVNNRSNLNRTPNPANPAGNPGEVNPAGAVTYSGPAQKVQVFADKRTNRVVVLAPAAQMPYIRSLIQNLDAAIVFEPLERPLRFVRAADALPVLSNILAENDDQKNAAAAAGNTQPQNQTQPSSDNNSNNNSAFGGSTGGGGSGNRAQLNVQAESSKPQSVIIGNSRIIADLSLNKIIIIGPPEAKARAAQVLDMLDRRPKQVYLACVIGQLTLGNNIDFGIDYLARFGDVRVLGQGQAGTINNLISNRTAALDLVPGTTTAVNAAATVARTALPVVSGLSVFGAIGDSVDVYARALASTNRFKIISRPMIYTANGQIATISSGQRVPFAGNTQSNINTSNVNDVGTTLTASTEYQEANLELAVRPLINSDSEVTLNISQVNDTVGSSVTISAGTTAPTINTQKLDTTVTVPNRQTIVLGGLISDQEDRTQTGIPLLKDIPYVGYLFASTQKSKTRRELIVLIQPFIIDNDPALQEANLIEHANVTFRKDELFEKTLPVRKAELPTAVDLQVLDKQTPKTP